MLEMFLRAPTGLSHNACVTLDYSQGAIGGGVLNTAVHLSALGRRVAICAVIPKSYGRAVTDILADRGISSRALIRDGAYLDYLMVLQRKRGYEAVYLRETTDREILVPMVNEIPSAKVLVVVGTRRPAMRVLSAKLARRGDFGWVLFSPSYPLLEYRKSEAAEMVRLADVSIVNRREAQWLRTNNIKARARPLVVTRDQLGATLHVAERSFGLPRLSRVRGEHVGTGDAFASGLAEGHLRGFSLLDSAVLGSVIAARVAESGEIRPRIDEQDILASLRESIETRK